MHTVKEPAIAGRAKHLPALPQALRRRAMSRATILGRFWPGHVLGPERSSESSPKVLRECYGVLSSWRSVQGLLRVDSSERTAATTDGATGSAALSHERRTSVIAAEISSSLIFCRPGISKL